MYHAAPCNDETDPTLHIEDDGVAELRIEVDESYHHAAGGVHGSYYFKALDDATFFAANSLVEDVFVLTTDFHLQLTRPVSTGELVARAEVVNDHPKQLIADGVLEDGEGNQLARGTGTFAKSGVELDAEVGYE
ncbi:hotdog fold thioesterase [Natronomonas sp. CBA1123]|nr:hotdog fold thioesterase [Natronomonas sp. CBA1123]